MHAAVSDPTQPPPLLVLTGPTGSGKSALALEFAERHGLEILSMDSMAIYRLMDIGTAKPTAEERARVPHWLIDLVAPNESFDTSRWLAAAESALADVQARGRRPLFVGGTPLYLQALRKGLMPGVPSDPTMRAGLHAREAEEPGALHRELAKVDPLAAMRIHAHDTKRLVRALEVHALTGRPISELQEQWAATTSRHELALVAIGMPREELHDRIKVRTTRMLEAGLVAETKTIRDTTGFSREAAAAIGYAQCLDWLRGRFKDEQELRNRIRRATHGLVRRQMTWLRRMPSLTWLPKDADITALGQAFGSASPVSAA